MALWLLLAWNVILTVALLVLAHFVWRTRLFIRGNGKEKKPNGLWMLDMHDYRNLEQQDKALLEKVEQLERFMAKKHGEQWPWQPAKD